MRILAPIEVDREGDVCYQTCKYRSEKIVNHCSLFSRFLLVKNRMNPVLGSNQKDVIACRECLDCYELKDKEE